MPRRTLIELTYQAAGFPAHDMSEEVTSFSYTDPASGESDTIDLTLNNINQKWNNGFKPLMGDILTAKIISEGMGKSLFCGRFCLDDCTMSFGSSWEVKLGGTSIPETHAFRTTEITRTWHDITFEAMITEIASKYQMTAVYEGPAVNFKNLEQTKKTDCTFVTETADKYGMAVKVFNGQLIVYSEAVVEAKEAVAVINLTQDSTVSSATYNHSLTGTYTGAKITYSDPKKEKDLSVVVGTEERLLKITEKCDNEADARKKAIEKVNASNKNSETLNISMMGNTGLMSMCNVEIVGAGKVDGKYFIDKATHKIDGTSGYTTSLEMHKVQQRIS